MSVEWRGREDVKAGMRRYGADVRAATLELAREWAPILETYAKTNRPWEDQTGNARQSLFAFADQDGATTTIYLSHGMPYGVWLELRNQGRYAIILPTLEQHYARIQGSYRRLLG